jgi:hypothetical protein
LARVAAFDLPTPLDFPTDLPETPYRSKTDWLLLGAEAAEGWMGFTVVE